MGTPLSRFAEAFDRYFSSGRLLSDPEVNIQSLCSTSLRMMRGDFELARGTGFFWRQVDGIALVTAWHNFSGLHHTNRATLHSQGAMPDRVKFRFMSIDPQAFQEQEVPLYLDENLTQPRWFVHPEVGGFFDICFLGLRPDRPQAYACVNDHFVEPSEKTMPGADAFIVGFPHGIGSLGVFPVWKRASIATDIAMPIEGHPKFLVDAAGRSGMSGAPVYRVERGLITKSDGSGVNVGIGNRQEFIGLYSGRAASPGNIAESSDLGFVWRDAVVREVLASSVLDEQPEPGKGIVKITEFFGRPPDSTEASED